MAWFQYEVFGNVIFDEMLTFEEVTELEPEILQNIRTILAEIEAEHVDFQPVSDGVQIHFSLKTFFKNHVEKACKEIQEVLKNHVRVKLLVLDRQFSDMVFFSINHQAMRVSNIPIR